YGPVVHVSAAGSRVEAVDLEPAVPDVDSLGILDRRVVLADPRARLVHEVHQRLGGRYQVGVVARARLGQLLGERYRIDLRVGLMLSYDDLGAGVPGQSPFH